MTEEAMIPLLSAATRIACGRMTAQHLNALHASVEQASCLGRVACGAGSSTISRAS